MVSQLRMILIRKITCKSHCYSWLWSHIPVIPVTQQAEIRRITVPRQFRQKFSKMPSEPRWVWWCTPIILATGRKR
jgi:hypothetical protein